MPDFSEKSLETMMFENRKEIHERGFDRFYENVIRQFRLPNGGIIDLFTFEIENNELKFRIIELKKGCIDSAAYWQIFGYFIEVASKTEHDFEKVTYELVLVGESLTEEIETMVMVGTDLAIYTYSFGYDGLVFNCHANTPSVTAPVSWGDCPKEDPYRISCETFAAQLRSLSSKSLYLES